MDTFARVELHEKYAGDKPDYDLLHKAMSEVGFAGYFFNGLKKKFLPTGMYHSSSATNLNDVLVNIQRAAAKTEHSSEGVVTRGDETLTWGLREEPLKLRLKPLTPPPGYIAAQLPHLTLKDAGHNPSKPLLAPVNWEKISSLYGTSKG